MGALTDSIGFQTVYNQRLNKKWRICGSIDSRRVMRREAQKCPALSEQIAHQKVRTRSKNRARASDPGPPFEAHADL
jgi:hypothetical protein